MHIISFLSKKCVNLSAGQSRQEIAKMDSHYYDSLQESSRLHHTYPMGQSHVAQTRQGYGMKQQPLQNFQRYLG